MYSGHPHIIAIDKGVSRILGALRRLVGEITNSDLLKMNQELYMHVKAYAEDEAVSPLAS
jgi:hypothetical protein